MPDYGVEFQNIHKSYGSTAVLRDINLAVPEGEFTVLVGPSGSGKSTLLRSLAGLEDVDGGRILIRGRDVTRCEPKDRDVAMVFQNYALYPHMTVAENITFGMRIRKETPAARASALRRVAAMLQLEDLLDRKPRQLSGGQRQRVAMARAIVRNPKAFLMDEPLSNLDAKLRNEVRASIIEQQRELGVTTLYVTHDQIEAMTMAHRVVVLQGGRIQQVGAPEELYRRPANMFVAGFIGSPAMNFLPAAYDGVMLVLSGGTCLALPEGHPLSASVSRGRLSAPGGVLLQAGIRPEDMFLTGETEEAAAGRAACRLRGILAAREMLGAEYLLHIGTETGERLVVRAPGNGPVPRVGEPCVVGFSPRSLHFFDPASTSVLCHSLLHEPVTREEELHAPVLGEGRGGIFPYPGGSPVSHPVHQPAHQLAACHG